MEAPDEEDFEQLNYKIDTKILHNFTSGDDDYIEDDESNIENEADEKLRSPVVL